MMGHPNEQTEKQRLLLYTNRQLKFLPFNEENRVGKY